ncbi:hypothetical protein HPG69_007130, partial [Diceros bicornis minor]
KVCITFSAVVQHSEGWFLHFNKMKAFTAALLLTLLVTLQYSWAVSPIGCDAVDSVAEKALDLINEIRRDGYLFQLLRITDAHLDKTESTAVYYLVLDVKESNCPVLSRKHGGECESDVSGRPSDIVIGQCKVIAATSLDESQDLKDLRVYHFNCTTSSVSSALANTKDSPVFIDFFEDTELYKKQADKALEKYKRENDDFASFRVDKVERVARARGGERTNYYVDFSVRNCSIHHFPRPSKEHRYIHGKRPHLGHPPHSGGHEHSPAGKPPFKPNGFRDNHPHDLGCPPPVEGKDYSDRPPVQAGAPPLLPPSGHPEGRGPGKGHFPFHWRQIGYVYRLPPLKKGEVLPLPEANFPSFSLPHHKDPLKPEIQPFLQSASESCPGKFKSEFLQVSEFFASTIPK